MFETAPTLIQHIKAGKLRGLAVTSLQRSSMLPDMPTMDEAGLKGFDFRGWIGLLAPAGTPDEIVRKLNATVMAALKEQKSEQKADLSRQLVEVGLDVAGGTPEQFKTFLREDIDKYGTLVKASGMKRQ
jgi:tripartite-type tricarboxylate transporter receptor subunit TctC